MCGCAGKQWGSPAAAAAAAAECSDNKTQCQRAPGGSRIISKFSSPYNPITQANVRVQCTARARPPARTHAWRAEARRRRRQRRGGYIISSTHTQATRRAPANNSNVYQSPTIPEPARDRATRERTERRASDRRRQHCGARATGLGWTAERPKHHPANVRHRACDDNSYSTRPLSAHK